MAVAFALTTSASEPVSLKLFVGGGIAGSGPNFHVSLTRDGGLKVKRTGLPIDRTGKFTESTTSIKIKPSEAKTLIALAEASTDFAAGCQAIPDGTTARLSLKTGRGTVERECIAGGRWPNGPKTREFLRTLNSQLPKKFQVF